MVPGGLVQLNTEGTSPVHPLSVGALGIAMSVALLAGKLSSDAMCEKKAQLSHALLIVHHRQRFYVVACTRA